MLTPIDLEDIIEALTRTTILFSKKANIMYDVRPTHCFIATNYLITFGVEIQSLRRTLLVVTPIGSPVCKKVLRDCPISIGARLLPAELVGLNRHSFVILLRMAWLSFN